MALKTRCHRALRQDRGPPGIAEPVSWPSEAVNVCENVPTR